MSPGDGSEPVADDEIVFRRVTEKSGWYNPESERQFAWEAFRPNANDVRGLSAWREKYKKAEPAATVRAYPGKR